MKKKYFNNLIISILISSFVLIPYSSTIKKANAQSISGYTSGLAPMIANLPLCREVINSEIKSLFSGVGDLLSSGSNAGIPEEASSTLESVASSAAGEFDSVKVNISGTAEGKAILETKKTSQETKAAVESINTNDTCIQSIGRLIIKMLLQKLTVSTVAWINSGFDGSPAFVQDPGKFFNDIARNEILQFGLEINNPELFPFGKIWMQNTAAAFNNKFQDNAQYSLNKLIQETNPEYSALTFQQDFSRGGWNAWTAMTQSPANNPLGFKLLADNEIQRRLAGTTQSVAQNTRDALQAANGFLGDQRCVEPKNLTREQHNAALVAGKKDENGNIIGVCQRWEYVTPGSMIAKAATDTISYPNNAYLNVQDLNDAVAAILDALLGQFSSNLMEKGFANLGDQGADGTLIYDSSMGGEPYSSQTEKDFMPAQLTSSWLSANPDFNIRTDLTQALIDEQRTYSDKLQLQNKELMSTTDGKNYALGTDGKSNAYGLMPTIYQLDYCIPGPHPGWEEDSRRVLSNIENLIVAETEASLENRENAAIVGAVSTFSPLAGAIVGAQIGSAVPVVGTIIGAAVGVAVSFIIASIFGDDTPEKVRMYYSAQIQALTGYLPDYGNEDDARAGNISSKQGAVQVIDTVLYRYIDIINKTYFSSPEILPTVSKEAATSFNQIAGYGQMRKNNEDKISSLKTVTNILGEIKNKINALNTEYKNPNGQFKPSKTEENYEKELKAQINAFGRLSASMVNGNDIASADNLLKQIIDKKEYIYNNLLKGAYGCEADLAKPQKQFPSVVGAVDSNYDWGTYNVNSVKRMTYPFPILYDYASTSGFGPGFLSFVVFSAENGAGGNGTNRRGPERIKIDDLVPQRENENMRNIPVNLRFESTIGIY